MPTGAFWEGNHELQKPQERGRHLSQRHSPAFLQTPPITAIVSLLRLSAAASGSIFARLLHRRTGAPHAGFQIPCVRQGEPCTLELIAWFGFHSWWRARCSHFPPAVVVATGAGARARARPRASPSEARPRV